MIQKPQLVDVDTTIDELHKTRERLAEKFGGNIAAILEDARRRMAASGRPIWQGSAPNKSPHRTATGRRNST
jgi:hypothetical protein